MCFHSKQSKKAQQIEHRFKATFENIDLFQPTSHYNGFDFPKTPIIINENTSKIQMCNWGLVPTWAKEDFNKTFTLNARIETLSEKSAFKNVINNRCIILVDGFYEWQKRGSQKIKYEIGFNNELFALAGIFSEKENHITYSILTTEAQGIMREIHNTKLRMPMALYSDTEISDWLNGNEMTPNFDFTASPKYDIQGELF